MSFLDNMTIQEINHYIKKSEQVCCGCEYWMTRACPQEINRIVRGDDWPCKSFAPDWSLREAYELQVLRKLES